MNVRSGSQTVRGEHARRGAGCFAAVAVARCGFLTSRSRAQTSHRSQPLSSPWLACGVLATLPMKGVVPPSNDRLTVSTSVEHCASSPGCGWRIETQAVREGASVATKHRREGPTVESAIDPVNPFDERSPDLLFNEGEKELAVLEVGWAKAALYFRTGWHFGHNRGSIRTRSLLAIHEELQARRARFERGNKVELLHAIQVCANENLPLPTWLSLAFGSVFGSYTNVVSPTASLDEAFGTLRPGKKAIGDKRDWELGSQLYAAAFALAVRDERIESLDALLRLVLSQKDWGVGKTKARELLLQIDETQRELSPSQDLSRFLELRRKQVRP